MRSRSWGPLLCVLFAGAAGCANPDKSERAVGADELPGAGAAADGTGWQTASFPSADDCAENKSSWLKLERKTKSDGLIIDHELGRVPDVILPYISFEASGCGSTLGGGDTVVIDYADDLHVKIHNNTGEYFYVRLVLQ